MSRALRVKFTGEAGIDVTGLTREFIHGVLTGSLDERAGLFERGDEDGQSFLPRANADPGLMFLWGTLLAKAVQEGVSVPALRRLPPLFWRVLLEEDWPASAVPVSMADYENFRGSASAMALQRVLYMRTQEELDMLCRDFSELRPPPKPGAEADVRLTLANAEEYVALQIEFELVKSRAEVALPA
jgi:hypothetical protein